MQCPCEHIVGAAPTAGAGRASGGGWVGGLALQMPLMRRCSLTAYSYAALSSDTRLMYLQCAARANAGASSFVEAILWASSPRSRAPLRKYTR